MVISFFAPFTLDYSRLKVRNWSRAPMLLFFLVALLFWPMRSHFELPSGLQAMDKLSLGVFLDMGYDYKTYLGG